MTTYTLTGHQTVDASHDPVGTIDLFNITGVGNSAIGHGGIDNFHDNGLGNSIDGGKGSDVATVDLSSATMALTGDLDGAATRQGLHLADGTSISNIETLVIGLGSADDVITAHSTATYCDIYGGGGDDQLTGAANGGMVSGGAGSDTLIGSTGSDNLFAFAPTDGDIDQGVDDGSGHDSLSGGDGDDFLHGSLGNDTLDGGAGTDWLDYDDLTGSQKVTVKLGAHGSAKGAAGHDALIGIENIQVIAGGGRFDMAGDSGANRLAGGRGADTFEGGGGGDTLIGGYQDGAVDTFVYKKASDSTAKHADSVDNFQHGTDRIDVHAIDADGNAGNGDTAFHVVAAFGGDAGEATITYDSASDSGVFSGDVNGDGKADLVIYVFGDFLAGDDLTASDFVL